MYSTVNWSHLTICYIIKFEQVLENPRRPIIKWHVLQDAEPEEDEDKDKDKDKKKKDKGDN